MTYKEFESRKVKYIKNLGNNTYEIITGGSFYNGDDEYDQAATTILNKAKFRVTFDEVYGGVTYKIIEFDGEVIENEEDLMDITTDIEQEMLCIFNDAFLMYSFSFEPNISDFIRFMRYTLRPMSVFRYVF